MILLQTLQESALQVSPWNALGYGVLVAILIYAVLALWNKLNKAQDMERETIVKMTELMTKIMVSMEDDKGLRAEVKEMISILKNAASHWEGIAAVKDKLDVVLREVNR